MAMFSGTRNQPASTRGILVEFKLESGSGPTKRMVVAEREKGLVYVKQSSDQLIHFCWKNRETGGLVDDLIVFPGDTEFNEVLGCPNGQVFMLKFKSSDDRRLFWAQDATIDKDLVQKVNDALNKPSSSQRIGARGGPADRLSVPEAVSFGEELGPLGGLDQRQLMQLLQFMNPSSAGTSEASLQNILSRGGSESSAGSVAGGSETGSSAPDPQSAAMAQADAISSQLQQLLRTNSSPERQSVEIDLADVTTGERVAETVRNNSERLSPYVPNTGDSTHEMIETIHSPMYRQASTSFGHALQTGQMGPVLDQFGINSEAKKAAQKGDLLEFAKNLTEAEQKSAEETVVQSSDDTIREPEPKRGKPDDQMDLH